MKKVINMDIGIHRIPDGVVIYYDWKGDCKDVWEQYEWEDDDKEGLRSLLYGLLDEIETSSRYDKQRVRIKIEHGDKYECKEKNCKICKGDY
jgi:hypothetical protein